VILLDDVGFGHPGTFGGPIPTPKLDELAGEGIRFNAFHSTGICSPTRAAALTGLNHHQVGFGTIAELSSMASRCGSTRIRSSPTMAFESAAPTS
jgi:arylsulfatase A-like enzyme